MERFNQQILQSANYRKWSFKCPARDNLLYLHVNAQLINYYDTVLFYSINLPRSSIIASFLRPRALAFALFQPACNSSASARLKFESFLFVVSIPK
uniref:AlNc14C85G5460 protein n=1 Tax=Albugo laibachii Nc14 TaxID=890382 RepID=F0WFS5_9STRA|nr:AlNc14C85G5460 [Albugo laibachii Nc14]|eukprot:CCA20059.1 AlNc14C85G5460 [Albugo laibachii Nc14]